MSRIRLNRFLALSGIAARRKCEAIIGAGRVTVNGEVVSTPARIVDTSRDVVTCDGHRVRPSARRHYYLLHKPAGVLSTLDDPRGRPTITGLLPRAPARLYPAGRLDAETTGLMLLTDDGRLAFRVMHPRYRLPKRYLALVRGRVRTKALGRLKSGVLLDDGPASALEVCLVASDGATSVIWLSLGEGRKRQVRRMCEAVGHPVVRLHRDAIGPVRLGELEEGRTRELAPLEVRLLRRQVGLGDF